MKGSTSGQAYLLLPDGTGTILQPVSASNPLPVTLGTGSLGTTSYSLISANSINATSVNPNPSHLTCVSCFTQNAINAYLKIYDKASAPIPGTDTPIWRGIVPGVSGGAGFICIFPGGKQFLNGLAFCITGGISDSDTSAVAANSFTINLDYF